MFCSKMQIVLIFFVNVMLQITEMTLNLHVMKFVQFPAFAAFAAAIALCASPLALAQYEWLDHNGRHVYSDQLPPADIPEANILKAPRAQAPRQVQEADEQQDRQLAVSSGAAEAASDAQDSAELEQKKQELDAAEQARAAAQEKEQQAMRADNCQRAQQSKRTLESGMRMARVNDAGERIVLDDAQRAAELARANEIIASNC